MLENTPNSNLKYPWQQAVLEALTDYRGEPYDKVMAAERAISGRLRQQPTDLEELLALRDASCALQIVFPDTNLQIETLIQSIHDLST